MAGRQRVKELAAGIVLIALMSSSYVSIILHQLSFQVNVTASMSPGENTVKISKTLNRKRQWTKQKQKTAAFKKRRLQLKKLKRKSQNLASVKEGDTYKPNLDMASDIDIETIPSPPQLNGNESFIIFDLETTGLSRNSDISQIAAYNGVNKFNNYVLPRCDISKEASKITGITFHRSSNKMYQNGEEVQAVTQREALLNFIEFLEKKDTSILVGHNIAMFDIPILLNKLKEFGLVSTAAKSISGYIDTVKVARRVFPKDKVANYKQETLVNTILGKQYSAHNASEDVMSLHELFSNELLKHCGPEDVHSLHYHLIRAVLKKLVEKKIISDSISLKLSRHGISTAQLKLAQCRDPNGARAILQEHKIATKTIANIVNFLQEEE